MRSGLPGDENVVFLLSRLCLISLAVFLSVPYAGLALLAYLSFILKYFLYFVGVHCFFCFQFMIIADVERENCYHTPPLKGSCSWILLT